MKHWWKNFAHYIIVLCYKLYNTSHILYVLLGVCEYKLVFVKT
jgi:hypothetical protein